MKRQSIRIREHGSKKSTCYVTTFQGPLSVWNAYHRGAYGDGMTSERVSAYSSIEWGDVIQAMAERGLRWGAYGDPAALPLEVLEYFHADPFNEGASVPRWTGYTHQWRREDAQALRSYLMASVDSLEEEQEAQAMGWRTFLVEHSLEDDLAEVMGYEGQGSSSIVCPASDEGGMKSDCQTCGLCNGAQERTGSLAPGRARLSLPKGVVLYRGPSKLDGEPIVCIATGLKAPSKNPKTGTMVQTWILREDVAPHKAQKTGEDSSVCGDCPLRPLMKGKETE